MDDFVCGECVDDPCLAEFIEREAEWETCSYCNRSETKPIAVELGTLANRIEESFSRDYTNDLAAELPYDDEEGDFSGSVYEIGDVLYDFGFSPRNDKLLEDICAYFDGESYAAIGTWSGTSTEHEMGHWESFCKTVKHRRRYTFWNADRKYAYSPREMIGNITKSLSENGLIHQLPPRTKFWRARVHEGSKRLTKGKEFTSPPEAKAVANRMSPAGVPMFYGCDTFETACLEVVGWHHRESDGNTVTAMSFETVAELNILDLTAIRQPRSWFESWDKHTWYDFLFLREFVKALAKPVAKTGGQHIEYVPTQVFTEYVRFNIRHQRKPVHGVVYPSCHDNRRCIVLFATQDQCVSRVKGFRDGPQLLRPQTSSLKSIQVSRVKRQLASLKKNKGRRAT